MPLHFPCQSYEKVSSVLFLAGSFAIELKFLEKDDCSYHQFLCLLLNWWLDVKVNWYLEEAQTIFILLSNIHRDPTKDFTTSFFLIIELNWADLLQMWNKNC